MGEKGELRINERLCILATNATRPPSVYEQHKVDFGDNTENTNNEGTSMEEQRVDPSPAHVEQRTKEQLLHALNIHDSTWRKAYIVLYLEEEA